MALNGMDNYKMIGTYFECRHCGTHSLQVTPKMSMGMGLDMLMPQYWFLHKLHSDEASMGQFEAFCSVTCIGNYYG